MTPQMRQRIEQLVEALIGVLDAADGDHDLEDGHDAEHDPAELGVADIGGADEALQQLWFKQAFEEYRQAQRLEAMRAATPLRTID